VDCSEFARNAVVRVVSARPGQTFVASPQPLPRSILEYIGLDTSRVGASHRKVTDAIARRDFAAAKVKKGLANTGSLGY